MGRHLTSGRPSPTVRIALTVGLVFLLSSAFSATVDGVARVRAPAEEQTLITFEDYPADISGKPATAIDAWYANRGVRFPSVTALRFSKSSFPPAPGFAHSGETVITTCYSQEFCATPITMIFERPLARIAAYAGSAKGLRQPATVLLEAFDAQGRLRGEDTLELPASLPNGGLTATATVPEPIPVRALLEVVDRGGAIRSARIRWTDPERDPSSLHVDDVSMTVFVPDPRLEADPTTLSITASDTAARQTIKLTNTGNVPFQGLSASFRPESASAIADVSLDDDSCSGVIAPGTSCTVVVQVVPKATGELNGTVEVTAADAVRAMVGLTVRVGVGPTTPSSTAPPTSSAPTTSPLGPATGEPTIPTVEPTDVSPTSAPPANDPQKPETSSAASTLPPSETASRSASSTAIDSVIDIVDESPWLSPLLRVAGVAGIFLFGALIVPFANRLIRRRAVQPPPDPRPEVVSIELGSDAGHQEVHQGDRPVVTLTAALRGSATTIEEQQP